MRRTIWIIWMLCSAIWLASYIIARFSMQASWEIALSVFMALMFWGWAAYGFWAAVVRRYPRGAFA